MNAKRSRKKNRPITVTVGNVTVTIYTRTRADGSQGFEVSDYSTGARRLRSFATIETAKAEADRIARLMSSGDVQAAQMRNSEAASYGRAIELLRPTGLALELVAAHFAKAYEILGGDLVIKAAEYYQQNRPDRLTPKTVAEVVLEFIATKEARGRTENTISDLRARLNTFAENFGTVQIATVTTPDVQTWLDGLNVSERTRLNYRAKVSSLFTFSERRGYIPKRTNPVLDTEKPDANEARIEIYTPTEIERLLTSADDEFKPCVALGAFAGLRSSEVQRLDWSDIDFAKGVIMASAKKRGTPSRRFVPITDNLKSWLLPHARKSGLVWKPLEINRRKTEDWFSDAQAATSAATLGDGVEPVPWKANALRHSFISYRLAEIKNANQVALEAGNSAGTIFKHYRELVSAEDAKSWFSIKHSAETNIIPMQAAL